MALPADEHEFLGGRPLPDVLIEVHGEERTRTVERGAQIAHGGREHYSYHKTSQS